MPSRDRLWGGKLIGGNFLSIPPLKIMFKIDRHMRKIHKVCDYILSQHKKNSKFKNLKVPYILKDEKEAYEVQFDFQKNAKRGKIGGYKIALASKVQQQLCSIDNPIAGGIFKNEIHQSPKVINLNNYQSLGIEFELAFEINQDIFPNTFKNNKINIKNYVNNAYCCFELIDDRHASYTNLDALTLIADNAWSSGIILSKPNLNWKDLDLNKLNSKLYWNNILIGEAKLFNTNPLNSLIWILKHLGKFNKKINEGSIIITGSLLKTKKPKSNDHIKFEIENLSSVEAKII